ncbi:hypothetical protein [Streptomyces aurantiogriseus]|uniref:Uncharacterized protein n=1 Tax=Streptomyces aurantiogriseus TaxID=66870 RepID=A0A918KZS9_9ACTN|nr:hypothetical protein [Streptomyces aurantiogriseus]GGR60212.1 hypothetical protein GCM10010251_91130 [Streptomyces aurantiogriseus]
MGETTGRAGVGALAGVRTGDIVTLRCSPREAVVAEASAQYVTVQWPWNAIDPNSLMQWNGLRDIPRTPEAPDWDIEPFQVVSPSDAIERHGVCEVGIPETVAYVIHVAEFPEPLDVGWLPRPRTYVSLMAHGVPVPPFAEEIGFTLDPDGDEPIESELIYRPYAFLVDGDEVADSEGRMWRFSVPWNWTAFDDSPGEYPVWPLQLIWRDGGQDPQAAEAVARATSSGAHGDEIARWLARAGLDDAPQLPPSVLAEDL